MGDLKRVMLGLSLAAVLMLANAGTAVADTINPDLSGALKRANASGKQLLVDFYGDWCPWCVKMDETLADPSVKSIVQAKFYYYKLDVGQFDRHQGCLSQYGVEAIPYLIAFDAQGAVRGTCEGYKDAAGFKKFLQDSRGQGSAAAGIHPDLAGALKAARRAKKTLLVDFYGAWCPWCVKMDETLADPTVKGIVQAKFYYYKLDVGHFDQHQDCIQRYNVQGIPHIIVFSDDGSVRSVCEGYKDPAGFKAFLQAAFPKSPGAGGKLAVYKLDDFGELGDPVMAAVKKAGADGRHLMVYFYEGNTAAHASVEEAIRKAGGNGVAAHLALLRVEAASNPDLARHYGCSKAPFLILFTKEGSVSSFFEKAMTSEKLIAAMRKCVQPASRVSQRRIRRGRRWS